MKKIMQLAVVVMALATIFASCGSKGDMPKNLKKQGFKVAENGMFYKYENENKEGRVAEPGEIIFGSLAVRYNDSTLNKVEHQPISQGQASSGQRFNVIDNVNQLHEGDVVTFAVLADTILAITGTPQALPPMFKEGAGDIIYYDITIEKIMNQTEYASYMMQQVEEAKVKDSAAFAQYLADNNVTVSPSSTGLYTIIREQGNGPKVTKGKTVKVNYTGRLLDGTVFDSSEGREPIAVTVGEGQVIAGWEEGLNGLTQGTKATLIIPYQLAYGERQVQTIPACSSLVFDIEIVEVQ